MWFKRPHKSLLPWITNHQCKKPFVHDLEVSVEPVLETWAPTNAGKNEEDILLSNVYFISRY